MDLRSITRRAAASQSSRAQARYAGRTPKGFAYWTEREIGLLKKIHPDLKRLREVLPGRSYSAIKAKGRSLNLRIRRAPHWTQSEISLLRRTYSRARIENVKSLFPRHTWVAIKGRANKLGLKRPARFLKSTGNTIVDQVRDRAREFGMTRHDLDTIAGTKSYFRNIYVSKLWRADLTKIMKAVEALGGKILIQWEPLR